MAQVKDLLVNGDARVIGKLYADQTLPDGIYYLNNVTGTAAITSSPYTSALWTATSEARITKLYSGLTIAIKVPVAGNNSVGTMLDINGLGYHPVVVNVNTWVSTRYSVGSTLILTYNATQTATGYYNSASSTTYTGVWQFSEYDSTVVNQLRDNSSAYVNSSAGALYRYELCMTNKNMELIPFNNTSNARTTYTKEMNSQPFDPFGAIFYYNSTSTINAGSATATSTLYDRVCIDSRFALNIQSDGTAGTTALTGSKPIYIKALYNKASHTATFVQNVSSSSYLDRSSIVQALPSSNPDGGLAAGTCYIYIYLGRALDKYQMDLVVNHPVYVWDSVNGVMGTLESVFATSASLEYTVLETFS